MEKLNKEGKVIIQCDYEGCDVSGLPGEEHFKPFENKLYCEHHFQDFCKHNFELDIDHVGSYCDEHDEYIPGNKIEMIILVCRICYKYITDTEDQDCKDLIYKFEKRVNLKKDKLAKKVEKILREKAGVE